MPSLTVLLSCSVLWAWETQMEKIVVIGCVCDWSCVMAHFSIFPFCLSRQIAWPWNLASSCLVRTWLLVLDRPVGSIGPVISVITQSSGYLFEENLWLSMQMFCLTEDFHMNYAPSHIPILTFKCHLTPTVWNQWNLKFNVTKCFCLWNHIIGVLWKIGKGFKSRKGLSTCFDSQWESSLLLMVNSCREQWIKSKIAG